MHNGNQMAVRLTPNVPRIIAAIYWVIVEANRRGRQPSQYDIVKTLFLADREHLNEWGRPITYDNYVAMKHGPVPSLCYNLLKSNEKAMRDFGITNLPWSARSAPTGYGKKLFTAQDDQLEFEQFLSESDVEALETSLTIVLKLGFSQIRRLTHEDPAYVEAWREDGDRKAYDMKLELLFEAPNVERAQILAEQSAYV
ncbi:Panacea domain-containing protein [uncultured Litoreibacter sp.]|uniref:Panacea domain-containing protein n=1 Tax=uncultured Litoreibacter sp. TaxID=1392394 RepID=UPI0026167232|nr:Panacea domain-containing protein [uncultured Litoreibacter sp.]